LASLLRPNQVWYNPNEVEPLYLRHSYEPPYAQEEAYETDS